MIITKEFAEKLNKETLAGLATKYCNELAEKLGSDKKIIINPNEIIYRREEAEQVFTDPYLRMKAQEKQPFTHKNITYTPLSRVSLREKVLIYRVIGHDDRKYATLRGFGAEMGHLTGKKIYGNKNDSGLEEAIDCLSQLHEISTDVKTLCDSENVNFNPEIEKVLLCETLVGARERLDTYEKLLFEGENSAIEQLSKVCQSEAKNMLEEIKQEYTTTMHFEGIKLLMSLYDNQNLDLNKTYKKAGEILSNPKVNTTLDALTMLYNPEVDTILGRLKWILSPNKEISKYKNVFANYTTTRIARLNKHKN